MQKRQKRLRRYRLDLIYEGSSGVKKAIDSLVSSQESAPIQPLGDSSNATTL